MLSERCESWLDPSGTRSNLVSQRDGRRKVEERDKQSYSSIKVETTTIVGDQNNYHGNAFTKSSNARVGGDNHNTHNHYTDGQTAILADSDGEEPDALKDATTTRVIACFGGSIQFVLSLQQTTPWGLG